ARGLANRRQGRARKSARRGEERTPAPASRGSVPLPHLPTSLTRGRAAGSSARNRIGRMKALISATCLLVAAATLAAQAPQEKAKATPPSELTVDEAFDPPISDPAFPLGAGPRVVVDERHRNVVSLASYFRPVGRFLEKDGYVLRSG